MSIDILTDLDLAAYEDKDTTLICRASDEIKKLRQQVAELTKRAERAERERDELINVFENELAKEAEKYIELSNDVVSGAYKNQTPEGSIYNVKIYVETRLKDITDPLFVSSKEQMEKRDTEQQYIGGKKLLDSIAGKYPASELSSRVCLVLARNLEQLRAQRDKGG